MKTALFAIKYLCLVGAILATIMMLPLRLLSFLGDLAIFLFDDEHLLPDPDHHFLEPIQAWLWKYKGYTWCFVFERTSE